MRSIGLVSWPFACFLAIFATVLPLSAATEKELEVVARSLRFMPEIAGDLGAEFGILVDPAIASSRDESTAVLAILQRLGKRSQPAINPVMVDVDQMSSFEGLDVVFVTSGLADRQSAIFDLASRGGILTISTDETCVDSGHCVMWVKAEPSVQIVVHRAAASASNVRFQTAFRMLITER